MELRQLIKNTARNAGTLAAATHVKNPRVILSLLRPGLRGFILQRGKHTAASDMRAKHRARFNWRYCHDRPELERLYSVAKQSQWNATDLDWGGRVDPHDESRDLLLDSIIPFRDLPAYRRLPAKEQQLQRRALLTWLLSQFLHGEQGALFAACQVTESVDWVDAKLYGATQVVDEARHVEVFGRYLRDKLESIYDINDNLYVIIDSLMTDHRWDMKFLGMQIMVEGLALGAFGTMRTFTREPLLRQLLHYVITDEARHVHYGVIALAEYYRTLPPSERHEREDWAFEISLLLRNRFLAHEFYDQYYGHALSRSQWDHLIQSSRFMQIFRRAMFKRIIPNLKRIHLLSARIRPYYEQAGLLTFEGEKAAPDLDPQELLVDAAAARESGMNEAP